jgi:hypothetical protein
MGMEGALAPLLNRIREDEIKEFCRMLVELVQSTRLVGS